MSNYDFLMLMLESFKDNPHDVKFARILELELQGTIHCLSKMIKTLERKEQQTKERQRLEKVGAR